MESNDTPELTQGTQATPETTAPEPTPADRAAAIIDAMLDQPAAQDADAHAMPEATQTPPKRGRGRPRKHAQAPTSAPLENPSKPPTPPPQLQSLPADEPSPPTPEADYEAIGEEIAQLHEVVGMIRYGEAGLHAPAERKALTKAFAKAAERNRWRAIPWYLELSGMLVVYEARRIAPDRRRALITRIIEGTKNAVTSAWLKLRRRRQSLPVVP